MEENICRIMNITKTFPGVVALDNVSFDIKKGEIQAIIGENGAGKSTLMNILSGVYHPDSGQVEFDGKNVRFKDPRDAQHHGIAMIHQELSLARYMTVAENIYQGRMPVNGVGMVNRRKMNKDSREFLNKLNVTNIDPRTLVKFLSVSQMQLVEIAKAVSLNAKMLIMDEPTSSLTTGEIKILLDIMNSLKAQGVSILFITHKLEEVLEVADRITVLRDGKYISTMDKKDATLQKMVSMMVGRDFDQTAHREFIKDYKDREVVLEVENLNVPGGRVKNASFKLYKGEVLGLTGLVGAGRTELLQGIFGYQKIESGKVTVNGSPVKIKHPAHAIKLGLGLVPEGRKEQGMFLKLNVEDNMSMVHLPQMTKGSFIQKRKLKKAAGEYVGRLSIKTTGLRQISETLSGGNQQKTIIARWLMNSPQILFMDEPTHGIDVGAKAEIYRIIDDLSKQGVSVILLSSELPEVLALCDRIMVMHHGEIRGIIGHEEADQVKIMNFTLEAGKESA